MNPLFSCDHMHEVGRGTDSGKEWNYAYGRGDTPWRYPPEIIPPVGYGQIGSEVRVSASFKIFSRGNLHRLPDVLRPIVNSYTIK